MESKNVSDLIPIIHALRKGILTDHAGEILDEDIECELLLAKLLHLEASFSSFEELDIVKCLKALLERHISQSSVISNAHCEMSTSPSTPLVTSLSTIDESDRTILSVSTNIQRKGLEPIRREYLQKLALTVATVPVAQLLNINPPNITSSANKKHKCGSYFSTFNFDEMPAYEPIEPYLAMLRKDTHCRIALEKFMSMDVGELIEHSQWHEILQLLARALSWRENVSDTSSLHSRYEHHETLLVIQIHVRFLSYFTGSQAIDVIVNMFNCLFQKWVVKATCDQFPPMQFSLIEGISFAPVTKAQIGALNSIISSISRHLILCSDKTADTLISTLFLLLAKGKIPLIHSHTSQQFLYVPLLDLLPMLTFPDTFCSELLRSWYPTCIINHAFHSGLMWELYSRISKPETTTLSDGPLENMGLQRDIKSIPQSDFAFLDIQEYGQLLFIKTSQMWLQLLAPFSDNDALLELCSCGLLDNSSVEVSAVSLWDGRISPSGGPLLEIVPNTNKKFSILSGASFLPIMPLNFDASPSSLLSNSKEKSNDLFSIRVSALDRVVGFITRRIDQSCCLDNFDDARIVLAHLFSYIRFCHIDTKKEFWHFIMELTKKNQTKMSKDMELHQMIMQGIADFLSSPYCENHDSVELQTFLMESWVLVSNYSLQRCENFIDNISSCTDSLGAIAITLLKTWIQISGKVAQFAMLNSSKVNINVALSRSAKRILKFCVGQTPFSQSSPWSLVFNASVIDCLVDFLRVEPTSCSILYETVSTTCDDDDPVGHRYKAFDIVLNHFCDHILQRDYTSKNLHEPFLGMQESIETSTWVHALLSSVHYHGGDLLFKSKWISSFQEILRLALTTVLSWEYSNSRQYAHTLELTLMLHNLIFQGYSNEVFHLFKMVLPTFHVISDLPFSCAHDLSLPQLLVRFSSEVPQYLSFEPYGGLFLQILEMGLYCFDICLESRKELFVKEPFSTGYEPIFNVKYNDGADMYDNFRIHAQIAIHSLGTFQRFFSECCSTSIPSFSSSVLLIANNAEMEQKYTNLVKFRVPSSHTFTCSKGADMLDICLFALTKILENSSVIHGLTEPHSEVPASFAITTTAATDVGSMSFVTKECSSDFEASINHIYHCAVRENDCFSPFFGDGLKRCTTDDFRAILTFQTPNSEDVTLPASIKNQFCRKWFFVAVALTWPFFVKTSDGYMSCLKSVCCHIDSNPAWRTFFSTRQVDNHSAESIVRDHLMNYKEGLILRFLDRRLCPLCTVIDSIIRNWFFGYLNLTDIRAITVISVVQGPTYTTSLIAALIVCIIDAARRDDMKEEADTNNLRGPFQFMLAARKFQEASKDAHQWSSLAEIANHLHMTHAH